MKINDLVIDANRTLGGQKLLTAIIPSYKYENGEKTAEIDGYNYEVVLTQRGFEKIRVKIEGPQAFDMPSDYPLVEFEGLEIKAYVIGGNPLIKFGAKAIKIVKTNA